MKFCNIPGNICAINEQRLKLVKVNTLHEQQQLYFEAINITVMIVQI